MAMEATRRGRMKSWSMRKEESEKENDDEGERNLVK